MEKLRANTPEYVAAFKLQPVSAVADALLEKDHLQQFQPMQGGGGMPPNNNFLKKADNECNNFLLGSIGESPDAHAIFVSVAGTAGKMSSKWAAQNAVSVLRDKFSSTLAEYVATASINIELLLTGDFASDFSKPESNGKISSVSLRNFVSTSLVTNSMPSLKATTVALEEFATIVDMVFKCQPFWSEVVKPLVAELSQKEDDQSYLSLWCSTLFDLISQNVTKTIVLAKSPGFSSKSKANRILLLQKNLLFDASAVRDKLKNAALVLLQSQQKDFQKQLASQQQSMASLKASMNKTDKVPPASKVAKGKEKINSTDEHVGKAGLRSNIGKKKPYLPTSHQSSLHRRDRRRLRKARAMKTALLVRVRDCVLTM